MSHTTPSPDSPQSSPEAKAAPEAKSWLSRLVPSFKEAWNKARASKDAGFFDKVKIFFISFWAEMGEVQKEEQQVSADTKAAVDQGIDETVGAAIEATNLSDDVSEEDRKFHKEMVATFVARLKSMNEQAQGNAIEAGRKLKSAADGNDEDPLTLDQARALSALGLMTLKDIRKRYPTKDKFKEALDRFYAISENSDYALSELLRADALEIFQIDLTNSPGETLEFLEAFNINPAQAMKARELFAGLSESPIKNESEIVKFMREHIFPHTSEANLTMAIRIMNKMITRDSDELDRQMLTDLVFYINEQDYDNLIVALLGEKNTENTQELDAEAA